MKERPILFSGPMVKAILEGRKTQTRRVAKVHETSPGYISPDPYFVPRTPQEHVSYCPYGVPGDRLWVRESFSPCGCNNCRAAWPKRPEPNTETRQPHGVCYREGFRGPSGQAFRPSIFMPRWASRITLEITDVRVQRLQEISEEDTMAEGVASIDRGDGLGAGYCHSGNIEWPTALASFHHLWDSINAKRGFGWNANPWVWALTFKVVR